MGTSVTPTSDADHPAGSSGVLIALGSQLETIFDRLARRQGNLTLVQFRVLDMLTAHDPASLEPWEIGHRLAMGSNHVTMVLDRLEHRGLVERRPHPGDRRRRLVTATPRGAETATRLAAHVTALEERLMSAALTPAERARLTTLAGALYETAAALVIPDTRQRPGP
jgi:DNA-binding MarR family transcriptional regulator